MQNMFKQDLEEGWTRSGGTSSKQGGKTETHSFEDIIWERSFEDIIWERRYSRESGRSNNYITIISLLSNISKEYFLSKVKENDAVKVKS